MTAKAAGSKAKGAGAAKARGSSMAQAERRKAAQRVLAREEIEFLEAMDRYQREKGRSFPTWSEVLRVLRSLGYRKAAAANGPKGEDARWQQFCAELKEQRDRLQLELTKLRRECEDYKKAVCILMSEDDFDFDEDAVLAEMGQGPSMEELIAELESKYAAQIKDAPKGG